MGLFGKRDVHEKHGKPLSDESAAAGAIYIQDYEPPEISPSNMFVEVGEDINKGGCSASGSEYINARRPDPGNTNETLAILSISSIGGISARIPSSPTSRAEKLPYQPIRYESAIPPSVLKAPPPSPQESLPTLQTTTSISPRTKMVETSPHRGGGEDNLSRYQCIPGPCMPSLDEKSVTHEKIAAKGVSTQPIQPFMSTDSLSIAMPSSDAKCSCLEMSMYEEENERAPQNSIPFPKSTFSRRINSFSQHIRSQSFLSSGRPRAMLNSTSMYSNQGDSESIIVKEDEGDARTLSTGSNQSQQDSLFSFTKISLDGTVTLVPANEEAQAQLEKWKRAAVIGNPIIRIAAIFLSCSVIVTTVFIMAFFDYVWSISRVICAVYTILPAIMILILELRRGDEEETACPEETIQFQLNLRRLVVRQFNLFKLVWGRGGLYFFTGTMSLTLNMFSAYIPGIFLILLGTLTMAIGSYSLGRLETLKTSYADDAFLEEKFQDQDLDRNGKINVKEFGNLLWSVGLEIGEPQIQAAFFAIDSKRKGKINFLQFKNWWFNGPSATSRQAKRNRFLGQFVLSKRTTSPSRTPMTVKRMASENSSRIAALV